MTEKERADNEKRTDGIDVITGDGEALHRLLTNGNGDNKVPHKCNELRFD